MGSLAEELGAALDEQESQIEQGVEPVEVSQPDNVADAQATVDMEKTDEAVQSAGHEEKIVGEEQQTAQEKTPAAPPATWSAQAKAIYATLPEVARKEIAKREADYARGIQQYAESAKGFDRLMNEFKPYEAMMRAEGSNPEVAVRSLMRTAYLLRQGSPQERGQLVMAIAQQFGADITPYIGRQEADGQPDPMQNVHQTVNQMLSPVLQKFQQWEESKANESRMAEQAVVGEVSSKIEAFQSATNEDGTPKHLYFENVRTLMSAYFANGQAKTLEQAYDMACWAHPEVRQALIAEKQGAEEAKRLEEAKRKASASRNASFDVQGQGAVGIAGQNKTSLRDELSSQLDAAMGSGRL